MHRVILLAFVCIASFEFSPLKIANAQDLKTYFINLNNYFGSIYVLPIMIPQKEEAGDVYSRPGTIFARKAECFGDAKTDSAETSLPRLAFVDSSGVAGRLAGDEAMIGAAAADIGAQIQHSTVVSYGENGKARWNQLTEKSISDSLANPGNNSCRERILRELRGVPENISGIPWIIQSVLYATVNVSYQTASAVDAAAKAEIDKKLKPLEVNGSVSTEQKSDSLVIVNTGKTAFPVAWRPAYISHDHLQYIEYLAKEDWFKYVLQKFDLVKSDQEILEILQKDFKLELKKLPRPKDVVENMSHGKPVAFNQKNEEHLAYLQHVNALLGLSQAIWGPGKPAN